MTSELHAAYMRAIYEKRDHYTRGVTANERLENFLSDCEFATATLRDILALPECKEPEPA